MLGKKFLSLVIVIITTMILGFINSKTSVKQKIKSKFKPWIRFTVSTISYILLGWLVTSVIPNDMIVLVFKYTLLGIYIFLLE